MHRPFLHLKRSVNSETLPAALNTKSIALKHLLPEFIFATLPRRAISLLVRFVAAVLVLIADPHQRNALVVVTPEPVCGALARNAALLVFAPGAIWRPAVAVVLLWYAKGGRPIEGRTLKLR